MSDVRRFLRTRSFAFALLLSLVLLVANIAVLPSFGSPSNFDTNLMLFAPFALVAMAATPGHPERRRRASTCRSASTPGS